MKQLNPRLTIKQIIKEEVKKHKSKKLKEGLMTKMFDYIDAVTTKGKLDYAAKKINKENPEFGKVLSDLNAASKNAMETVNNMSEEERENFYKQMDDLGF